MAKRKGVYKTTEEVVSFKVRPVGVAVDPKEIQAEKDATVQDVLDKMVENRYLPKTAHGQYWRLKVGNVFADEGKTLSELGIRDGDELKVVQEQRWG